MLRGKSALVTGSTRFVSPDRIAGLVAFLCGPDGADTTGSAISIDGGWSAA